MTVGGEKSVLQIQQTHKFATAPMQFLPIAVIECSDRLAINVARMIGKHLAGEVHQIIAERLRTSELVCGAAHLDQGLHQHLRIILHLFGPPRRNTCHMQTRACTEDGFESAFAFDLEFAVNGSSQQFPSLIHIVVPTAITVKHVIMQQ